MRKSKANSLRELEDIVNSEFGQGSVCFRGQSKESWGLIPSAYRTIPLYASDPDFDPGGVAEVERDTYREFDITADMELRGLETLERLSRAQHHGVPTRLLDWSTKIYVSTFFAVGSSPDDDGSIWCLNLSKFPFPKELGRQHRGGGFRIENINQFGGGIIASFAQPVSKPIVPSVSSKKSKPLIPYPDGAFLVWKPHRVDERLKRLEGLLSLYHSFEDEDLIWDYTTHIKDIEKKIGIDLLLKIDIPYVNKPTILNEILQRGIDEYYLFDDLDGLGASLARQHMENIEFSAKP